DGVWWYVSPACRRMFGFEPEEMVGRQGFEFVHPEDLSGVLEVYRSGVANPESGIPVRFRQRRKDGSWLWVESIGLLVHDERGDVREIRFSIRDVTAGVEAEAMLRRS